MSDQDTPEEDNARELEALRETSSAAITAGAQRAVGLVEDRKAKSLIGKIDREDAMERHFHNVLVAGLWLVGICVAVMFLVLVWNMVVGSRFRFLDTEQQADLFKFLFSGVLGSGVSAAARRVLGQGNKDSDGKPATPA